MRKRGREQKKTEKDAKTLRTAATRAFLATIPNPTENLTRPLRANLRVDRTKCEKCPFQNDLGSAAPRVFLPSKHNFVKSSSTSKNRK